MIAPALHNVAGGTWRPTGVFHLHTAAGNETSTMGCVNMHDAMVLPEDPRMAWSSQLQSPKALGHYGRPPDDPMNN